MPAGTMAMFKDGGFASCAKSEAPINAMLAWKHFEMEEKKQGIFDD